MVHSDTSAAKVTTSPWWIAFGSCLGLIVANGSICVFAQKGLYIAA